MIKFISVSKSYGNFPALKDINIEVNKGESVVLLGPSGCGKSTSLRLINRLIDATSGVIEIDGQDHNKLNIEELRRGIGYVIQNIGLLPHYNVFQNIAIVPHLLKWSNNKIEKRVDELLDMVGLDSTDYLLKYPHQLSGGEAQRIGVARALAADPPILLMDEPFGAVDPIIRKKLQNEFLEIQKKVRKSIVLVTHDIDEAFLLGDKIAILKDGEIKAFDKGISLLTNTDDIFVKQFLGSDSHLMLLGQIPITQIFKKGIYGKSMIRIESKLSLRNAIVKMLSNSCDELIVTDNNTDVGLLTMKDILAIERNK